jgi:hypothetical protein
LLNIFQEARVVKDFMAGRGSPAADEILAERHGSGNQMISDIRVKSFLTEGGEGGGAKRGVAAFPGFIMQGSQ